MWFLGRRNFVLLEQSQSAMVYFQMMSGMSCPLLRSGIFCSSAASILASFKLHHKESCHYLLQTLGREMRAVTKFTFTHSWLKRHLVYFYQIIHCLIYFGRKIPTVVFRNCQESFSLCITSPAAVLLEWAQSRPSSKNSKLCFWNDAWTLYSLF